MSEISKRILELLEKKKISYGELSKLTKIPKSALQRYATGETEKIPLDRLELIAKYLNVDAAYLMGWKEESFDYKNTIKFTGVIPIYGTIAAGEPIFAEQNIIDSVLTDEIHPEDFFGLKVKGDSMINAGIPDGSYVVFLKQETAENGQIVACRVNGDEATLKRFRQQGDTVLLSPENPKYEPIIISAADFESGYAQILGVAKQVITKIT